MAVKETKRIVLNTRMSDYGYWVVEIGTASAKHVSIMVCKVGITPDEAATLALTGVNHALGQRGQLWARTSLTAVTSVS